MTVTLNILEIGARGDGVALEEGHRYFVPFTLPGEIVEAEPRDKRGEGIVADLKEILAPSRHREPAPCKHFGTCGGCALQHWRRDIYAGWKNELIARALEHFPEARAVADAFLDHWAAGRRNFELGPMQVQVVIGDARETLPAWEGMADAWFLDGFSPAKNPELWSPDLMAEVARHTAPGGSFATYTAAGHVRRALADAGFAVERRTGHGRKRHMSTGTLL
mgnify:CR=1 FL=1